MTAAHRVAEFGVAIHESLHSFFLEGYADLQGKQLNELPEHPPMLLDFDGSLSEAWELTLESMEDQGLDADARESVDHEGHEFVPIAWFFESAESSEPVDAYLAANVADPASPILFVDPSGSVTPFADNLEALVERVAGG